jgi:hypothetical protein
MEVGHADSSTEQVTYGKMLVTPADFAFHKMIFGMPGSTQPMEYGCGWCQIAPR